MIDVIITCCGRYDLLQRTLQSLEGRTGIGRIFIHDDNLFRGGQIQAIDSLMQNVITPAYLHLEEDWGCLNDFFVSEALDILAHNPKVGSVSLRGNGLKEHNGQKSKLENGLWVLQEFAGWSGYSYAPSIRRTEDFKRCQELTTWNPQTPYICEKEIGQFYAKKGQIFVTTETKYFEHIGNGRTVQNSL